MAHHPTRAEIMERLSALSRQDILDLLTDEAISELNMRFSEFEERTQPDDLSAIELTDNSVAEITGNSPSPEPVAKDNGRAKRPLNAFMAFRSYYLKIFPEAQQKTASGFLTTLWHQDPYKNKWALVAKVYSFIRDQVGKDNIPLAQFLSIACPTMKLPEPSVYLDLLGWTVENDEGSQRLVRARPQGSMEDYDQHVGQVPNTEVDLVSKIVNIGFVAPQGIDLLERMGANQNGIMTADAARYTLPVSYTKEKIDFMETVQHDAPQAAKDLIGDGYDQYMLQTLNANYFNVRSVDSIAHLPVKRKYQDPAIFYEYSANMGPTDFDAQQPVLDLNSIPQNDSFDISSPFDIDEVLGYPQTEGQRTADVPVAPAYNPLEDFYYAF
ncbi:hypothetical protein CP532_0633 [Ophiocordyceps camponoti-leonardi (nom. inval.)]|nr:hypothetical protein CP532_0633 [Ophiocordyceps camponoti-leonardi (nom. inval.)]